MGESPTIERTFELLDRWRHLPKYQLERASGILFALYLPEVLGRRFDTEIDPLLVPEFPIKKALLQDGKDNHSINVDLPRRSSRKGGGPAERAFLVELKTDMASIDYMQLRHLRTAVDDVRLECLVKGVVGMNDGCCTRWRRRFRTTPRRSPPLRIACSTLLRVARNCCYHPDYRGSFSIKNVAPGPGYDDLAIADGNLAVARYQRALASTDRAQRQQTFADLRAYCQRDTLATLELRKALAALATTRTFVHHDPRCASAPDAMAPRR